MGVHYRLDDSNLLRCCNCGKYKVDTLEEFNIIYRPDGRKEWLCEECDKYRHLFRDCGDDLQMIVTPSENATGFKVFTKKMYDCKG